MTTTLQELVPAIEEVREVQTAIANKFTTHAAVTPSGQYHDTLERRIVDARDHIRRIDERLSALQRRGTVAASLGGVWHLTTAAVRVPLDVAAGVLGVALRGTVTKHKLLKNAREEYAITAFAVATERAMEHIAHDAGDVASSELLRSIRRDDEDLLTELGDGIDRQAEALAAAT